MRSDAERSVKFSVAAKAMMCCCCCVSSKSKKHSPVEVSVHFPSSCISMDQAGNVGAYLRLPLYKVDFDE